MLINMDDSQSDNGKYRVLYHNKESTLYPYAYRLLYMPLNERIQKVMAEQGLDQPALGKVAGVTKATVGQWLSGKIKSLKMEYAMPIQERYGYSVAWLVMGKGAERLPGWPFRSVSQAEFDELPPALKDEIEHHIQFVIHRWKANSPQKNAAAA